MAANGARRIPIALSMGTASWPEAGDSVDALLTHADEAMYADKSRQKRIRTPRRAITPSATATARSRVRGRSTTAIA